MDRDPEEFERVAQKLKEAIQRVGDRWQARKFSLIARPNPGGIGGWRSTDFELARREDLGGQFWVLSYTASYSEHSRLEEMRAITVSLSEAIVSQGNNSRYSRSFSKRISASFISEFALEDAWLKLGAQIREARPASIREVVERANLSP